MIELPPEAHALLEKARRDHNPTADDAERVRHSLHAKLGIAAVVIPTAIPSAAAASSAGTAAKGGSLLFGLKAGKVLLAVVTLSGVAALPLSLPRGDHDSRAPRAERAACEPHCDDTREAVVPPARTVAAVPEPSTVVLSNPERPSTAPEVRRAESRERAREERRARRAERRAHERAERRALDDAPRSAEPGDVAPPGARGEVVAARGKSLAASRAVARVGHLPSPPAEGARSPPPATLREDETATNTEPDATPPPELALIRRALTNLRDGAPQRALALLAEHAERYPNGAFASERRGLRIVALCASGRLDEGQRERVVFLRREGSAPVAERVRHACQEAPGP